MAKSARSTTRKENNRRKTASATVFSQAEAARNERLSAKLLELARQPKPETADVKMTAADEEDDAAAAEGEDKDAPDAAATAMDVDADKPSRTAKKRIGKRRPKKSKIVFAKYSDRVGSNKTKGRKSTK